MGGRIAEPIAGLAKVDSLEVEFRASFLAMLGIMSLIRPRAEFSVAPTCCGGRPNVSCNRSGLS